MEALPTDSEWYVSEKFIDQVPEFAKTIHLPMGPDLEKLFPRFNCHIMILSIGAAVRLIAPLLQNKKVDPAVVCVDDDSRFSIPILSGHVGRGNAFGLRVAEILGATPVVTTASDVRNTLMVDILGRDLGWVLDDVDRNVTKGCAAVVNENRVAFIQETGEPNWWPEDTPLPKGVEYFTDLDSVNPADFEILLIATDRDIQKTHPDHFASCVIYRPKSLVLGIGCDSNTPAELMERGIQRFFQENGLSIRSVKGLFTIDKKRGEKAILELSRAYNWPVAFFTPEELDGVPHIENPSDVVKKYVGTKGVSEPAAILGSGSDRLLVPKWKYKEENVGRCMTLAAARIPFLPRKESKNGDR